MKTKLSIVQIIATIITAFLPFTENMFTWVVWNDYGNISRNSKTMDNIINMQIGGFSSFLFWMFYVALVLIVLYCTASIFVKHSIFESKIMIAIPSVSLVLYAVLVFICNNHRDTFEWLGEPRKLGVSVEPLAYIGYIILVAIIVIECYKQFKCPKEFVKDNAETLTNSYNK